MRTPMKGNRRVKFALIKTGYCPCFIGHLSHQAAYARMGLGMSSHQWTKDTQPRPLGPTASWATVCIRHECREVVKWTSGFCFLFNTVT